MTTEEQPAAPSEGGGAITIRMWRWLFALTSIAVLLAIGYVLSKRIDQLLGLTAEDGGPTLRQMFDLDGEGNLPAWYSSVLWLLAAGLALLNGGRSRIAGKGSWHWVALAALFCLLSMDESISLHEDIGDLISPFAPITGGFFGWSWVFYGFALVAAAAVIFAKFVLSLPPKIFLLLGFGGAIYLGGALGAEMYGAAIIDGAVNFLPGINWTRLIIAEEFSEMFGVIVAICALLLLMRGDTRTAIRVI